jgi:hypothetical protein
MDYELQAQAQTKACANSIRVKDCARGIIKCNYSNLSFMLQADCLLAIQNYDQLCHGFRRRVRR